MPNQSTGTVETTQSSSYLNGVKTLQDKLPAVLDDFKKYYVFSNKNPTYSEYQTIYANIKGNMSSINNDLLTIYNNVKTDSQNLATALSNINQLIEYEKTRNGKLKSDATNINNNYNGSKILIDDFKEIYTKKYVINFLLFLGIIIGTTALIKVFGAKADVTSGSSYVPVK